MKRVIFGLFLVINPVFGQNNEFFRVLSIVESNNNKNAVGDNGKSIGIYQIHENYFQDARDFNKNLSKYTYKDCFNPEIARMVVSAYLSRYCKNGSMEDMARAHNSGPNWRNKKHLTNNYWARFQKYVKKI